MFAALLLCCSAPPEVPPLTGHEALALVAKLASDDRNATDEALKEFAAAGPRAKAAVPFLVRLLDPNNPKRFAAVDALVAIGPPAKDAVPALLKLLPKWNGSGFEAERVAVAVAAIDGPKLECTSVLLTTTARCTPNFLERSALLRTHPADVVRHLCELCADKEPYVRERAASFLGRGRDREKSEAKSSLFERAGDAAKLVPPALEKLLGDPNCEVLVAGAAAAVRVAPELSDKAVTVVIDCAKENVGKTKSGVYAHRVFEAVPERATAALLPLFDSANEPLREWAVGHAARLPIRAELQAVLKDGATVLARAGAARALGMQSADGAPALAAALKDGAFEVRFAAAEALVRVGTDTTRAAGLPVLVAGLSAADERARKRACGLLLDLRADAKPAVPDIEKVLKDQVPEVQFAAALTLVGIDAAGAAGAVPVLAAALNGREYDARRAAQALRDIGPPAKAAVPELVKHFESKDVHLRIACAGAVGCIDATRGADAAKVIGAVLRDAELSKGMRRSYALAALNRIGPPAKGALPVLAQLLTDDGPFHADVAIAMLALDPESAAARTWVRAALSAANPGDADDLFDYLPLTPTACAALVPDLLPLLGAKRVDQRRGACEALGAAGSAARDALPKLKALAETDPARAVRNAAAEAVKKVEAK